MSYFPLQHDIQNYIKYSNISAKAYPKIDHRARAIRFCGVSLDNGWNPGNT